jgi:hypothetical protein
MKKILLLLAMGAALTAQTLFAQVPSYVPTNGLVGYWPFSGNANDVSGNGNNGTNNGATLTTDRNGNANSAFNFDGNNTHIDVPSNNSLQLSNNYTISGWFNANVFFNTNISDRSIVSKVQSTGWYGGYEVMIGGLSNDITHVGNVGGNNFNVGSTGYNINTWYMFTATYNGSIMNLYMNGVLVNSQPKSGNLETGNLPLRFGMRDGNFQYFNGKIDDIGIWNRALTQQEITNLYNSSLTQTACLPANVPTTGLVGYWPFCGNANDESGNTNNGTVNGAALTTDRFGNANSAYSFDGVNDFITTNSIGIPTNTNISISVWLKPNGNFGIAEFLSLGSSTNTTWGLISGENWNGSPYLTMNYGRGCSGTGSSNLALAPTLNSWQHLVYASTGVGGVCNIYLNGNLIGQSINGTSGLCTNNNLYFGVDIFGPNYLNCSLDDIGIWNRVLTQEEITNLYNVNQCITNITVTDTLVINVGQLSFNDPVTWANNITIAPNPASSQININFNNITNLNGGTLKIINSLGQEVATTPITTSGTNSTMQLATWGGTGMYFVQIINPKGQIVVINKIILQ